MGPACVDRHVQDQLIIFMALAEGTSSLRVGAPSFKAVMSGPAMRVSVCARTDMCVGVWGCFFVGVCIRVRLWVHVWLGGCDCVHVCVCGCLCVQTHIQTHTDPFRPSVRCAQCGSFHAGAHGRVVSIGMLGLGLDRRNTTSYSGHPSTLPHFPSAKPPSAFAF